jgi:hypothetical protein
MGGSFLHREVRTGMENSYQRTGAWCLLLGNKQKLPYSDKVLFLAIQKKLGYITSL